MTGSFVSGTCEGERCRCGAPAQHKVEESVAYDDPFPNRHPLTAYVCDLHFRAIMGPGVAKLLIEATTRGEDHGKT